jgi:hypothetical protein
MTLQTPARWRSWLPSLRETLEAWGRVWERLAGRGTARSEDPLAFAADYDAVYALLGPSDLQRDEARLEALDLSLDLYRAEERHPDRFLGYYTAQGARTAFERYGFFELLRQRGFDPLPVGDVSDPDQHRLRIYDDVEDPDRLLVELVVGIREVTLPDGAACRFLFVNWLMMQDPDASFGPDRSPLPDQQRPGLGLFLRFAYLLKLVAARVGCDGLLNHPAHPHNGVLYGRVSRFVDPRVEGRFRALERDVDTTDLSSLTRSIQEGRVVDGGGEAFVWEPAAQVMPVSARARSWFESPVYQEQVAVARGARSYRLAPSP